MSSQPKTTEGRTESVPEQVHALLFSADPLRSYHYRERLEVDGYDVTAVDDAVEAFRNVRHDHPDLVFVDMEGDPEAAQVLLTLLGKGTTPAWLPIVCIDLRPWRPPADDFEEPLHGIGMRLVEPKVPAEQSPPVPHKLPAAS